MINNICHIGPALYVMGGISSVLASYKKLFKLPSKNIVASYNGSFVKSLPMLAALCIKLLLCPGKFDFYQIHTSSYGSFFRKYLISRCLRLRGKKYTAHIHGSQFTKFCSEAKPHKKKQIQDYLLHAEKIICITPDMETFLKEFLNGAGKYVVIPNPCESLASEPIKLENKLDAQQNGILPVQIVFSGRYGKRKGVYDLIEAFNKATFKNKTELFLFGDGEVEQVKECAAKSPKAKDIHVSGWLTHEDYLKELVKFDLLVLPSYAETFGMSLVEAMGIGLPVISTFSGGVPHVVKNGVDGYLVNAGDITALQESLEALVNNHLQRVEMGKQAWTDATTRFSGSVILEGLNKLYKELKA